MTPTHPDGSPARLMLSIGPTIYFVHPVRFAAAAEGCYRLARADGAAEYMTVRDALGVTTCSCPAARYNPAAGPCKHVRALVDVRLMEPPAPASPPLPVPHRTESHRPIEVVPPCPSPEPEPEMSPAPRPKGRRRGATSG